MGLRSFLFRSMCLWIPAAAALLCSACLGLGAENSAPAEVKTYGGFGGNATGGAGYPTVEVRTAEELRAALLKGNATILVKAPEIWVPSRIETHASNITLDGQGNTLRGDQISVKRRDEQMLKFTGGRNFIIKNIRLRNGGDNVAFYKGTSDIVVDHVSSTGAGDDGISISNGASNATVTHCFLAGNTRAIFVKYQGTTRVTVDHCIITKFWIRAPLLADVKEFDVRNNMIMDWTLTGCKPENGSNGNVMGNICVLTTPKGKPDNGICLIKPGKVFVADNAFKGRARANAAKQTSTTDAPLPAPPIVPPYATDLETLEKSLMSETAGAGCMPRDAVDNAYLALQTWYVGHDDALRIPRSGDPLPKTAAEVVPPK